jgi:hypothetical protein
MCTLRLTCERSDLSGKPFDIDGVDRSWRDSTRSLCRANGWNVEQFVRAVAHLFHPEVGNGRAKSFASTVWKGFENRVNPSVPEWFRRTIAHFRDLLSRGQPLPVAL